MIKHAGFLDRIASLVINIPSTGQDKLSFGLRIGTPILMESAPTRCFNHTLLPHPHFRIWIPLAVSTKRSHYRRLFGLIRTASCSLFRSSISVKVIF
ncbi:unnamed protein product [Albugo candida]|uniref:Uncharacterized protein n=1 Tax=Albugo candida TaxID=65357 RepID=A0A024FX55_9STRA|nr:unnamed protein product [Albugo candida]|eukprot:CCI11244.1 unnamed protein product [Albugo candida]